MSLFTNIISLLYKGSSVWKPGVLISLKIAVRCIVSTVSICQAANHIPCAGNKTWLWLKTHSSFVCSFHRLLSSQCFLFNTQHILFYGLLDRAKRFTAWAGCSVTSHSRLGLRVWNSPMRLAGFRTGRLNWYTGGCKTHDFSTACLLHTLRSGWERKLNKQNRGHTSERNVKSQKIVGRVLMLQCKRGSKWNKKHADEGKCGVCVAAGNRKQDERADLADQCPVLIKFMTGSAALHYRAPSEGAQQSSIYSQSQKQNSVWDSRRLTPTAIS